MRERDIQGIKDAARFAIQPNMKGFCGEKGDQQILRDYISDRNGDYKIVLETLSSHSFPHLNAFLGAIAEMSGADVFDNDVVSSYWYGNLTTEKVGLNTKNVLLENYERQFPGPFSEQLRRLLPEEIFLTHLSQVALIATFSENEPQKTDFINHCMIAHGKIRHIDKENRSALIVRDYLKKKDVGGYEVISIEREVNVDNELTPELSIGDDVAVHLGYLAAILTSEEVENLRYWTRKVAARI